MFSGIIKSLAEVKECNSGRLRIESDLFKDKEFAIGSSIAVSGACLSIVEQQGREAVFELASETMERSTLGQLQPGDQLNLEPALTMGEALDGHLVLGHVDGQAEVLEVLTVDQNTLKLKLSIPAGSESLVAAKGSITIAGVSLTVGEVEDDVFTVYIIPLTANMTTLGSLKKGDLVNFEADCFARYIQRILQVRGTLPK